MTSDGKANNPLSIRGTSEGLIIDLGEGEMALVLRQLEAKLGQSAGFFRGGRVALRAGRRSLSQDEIVNLGNTLLKWGVTLWAIECEAPDTRAAVEQLGLETRLMNIRYTQSGSTEPAPRHGQEDANSEEVLAVSAGIASQGILVRRTLRSGSALTHAGHIVIIGDVNPGSEVIAGGDIIVWGRLRGLAHAGAGGDEEAIICALRLLPAQLRIGSRVACRPSDSTMSPRLAQLARISDDSIVVEAWGDVASVDDRFAEDALAGGPWGRLSRLFRRG